MNKTIHITDIAVFIPNVIIEAISRVSDKLTATECAILLDLVQWGAANSAKLIPISQIAADTNTPPRSIKRALKRLRERGLISYTHTAGDHQPAEIGLILPRKHYRTRIPAEAFNELMCAIRARKLHLTSLRLLCFVWRETFGYKAKHNNERHFSDSYMKDRTGIERGNANRALRELKALNAIRVIIKSQFFKGQRTEIKHITALSAWLPPAVNLSPAPAINLSPAPAVNLSPVKNAEKKAKNCAVTHETQTNESLKTGDSFTAHIYEKISVKDLKNKDGAAAPPVLDNKTKKIHEGLEHLKGMSYEEMRAEAREYIKTLNGSETHPAQAAPAPVSDHKPVTALEMLNALTPSEREKVERIHKQPYFGIEDEDTDTAPAYDFADMSGYVNEHGTLNGYRAHRAAQSA